jgi:hypothetical protein
METETNIYNLGKTPVLFWLGNCLQYTTVNVKYSVNTGSTWSTIFDKRIGLTDP